MTDTTLLSQLHLTCLHIWMYSCMGCRIVQSPRVTVDGPFTRNGTPRRRRVAVAEFTAWILGRLVRCYDITMSNELWNGLSAPQNWSDRIILILYIRQTGGTALTFGAQRKANCHHILRLGLKMHQILFPVRFSHRPCWESSERSPHTFYRVVQKSKPLPLIITHTVYFNLAAIGWIHITCTQ